MYIYVGLATGTVEHWHLAGNTRLTEKDFVHVTGGGCPGYVNESAHPDFSKEGGNIEFGFYRANSQIPGQIDYSVGGGIDMMNAIKQGAAAARNMLGRHVAYDEVHWFWSDQYDANLQYAGFHSSWEQLVVRGRLDSDSFLACYVNGGRIDAAIAFNRAKELRRVIPLIRARRPIDLEQLRDESVDLRSLLVSS